MKRVAVYKKLTRNAKDGDVSSRCIIMSAFFVRKESCGLTPNPCVNLINVQSVDLESEVSEYLEC